jgi:dihydroxyacetone kinase-like protein
MGRPCGDPRTALGFLGERCEFRMMITSESVLHWINAFAAAIAANKDTLTELDSAIGDADHGSNMDRGFQAVLQKLPAAAGQDIGAILKLVGMTLISTVGGASGPLYGTLFLQMAAAVAGAAAGRFELDLAGWTLALTSGVEGVARRGKASLGDKTMLDALLPAVEALKAASIREVSLPEALRLAEQAARQGMLDTIPLVARKGRASYLGERSAGHQDPGATSAYFLLKAAADTWHE